MKIHSMLQWFISNDKANSSKEFNFWTHQYHCTTGWARNSCAYGVEEPKSQSHYFFFHIDIIDMEKCVFILTDLESNLTKCDLLSANQLEYIYVLNLFKGNLHNPTCKRFNDWLWKLKWVRLSVVNTYMLNSK